MNDLTLDTLSRKVSEKTNLSITESKEALKTAIGIIKKTLKEDGKIRIRDFGALEPKMRKPRKRYNFQTGETITTPAKKTVLFRPSNSLKEFLNK